MNAFQFIKDTREWLSPVLTESRFLEKGVLTPAEFIKAGDLLVKNCPTWSWQSGDKDKIKNFMIYGITDLD
jgi:ubiquitin-like-conjugating enzyme ATG3